MKPATTSDPDDGESVPFSFETEPERTWPSPEEWTSVPEYSPSSFPETDRPAGSATPRPAATPIPKQLGPSPSVLWCELSQLCKRADQLRFRMQQTPDERQRALLNAQYNSVCSTRLMLKSLLRLSGSRPSGDRLGQARP